MSHWNVTIASVLVWMSGMSLGWADDFRVLAWNVESNRPEQPPVSDAATIAGQLTQLMQDSATRAQVIALSEVEPKTFHLYVEAVEKGLGHKVDSVTSASGGFRDTDSLMLIVDTERFAIVDTLELHRFAGIAANFNVVESKGDDLGELRARSPLAVRIKDLKNQQMYWVVANHLARGEADLRTMQAKMLCLWAKAQMEPVVAAGDFNFDYDFRTKKGNAGFDAMMEGGVWQWLTPDPLIDSNWSEDRSVKDRKVDRYPDSILDFILVANGAKSWRGESDVVVREGDFPDNDKTSDHRPIIATFHP